jgi:hydrogenase expression/formation protein HypE
MSEKQILLAHGSGGRQTHELISSIFKKHFSNEFLNQGDDSASIPLERVSNSHKGSIAFTTDTFTVTPIFFPGGNIGDLAINGTVNDLASAGAIPLYLSAGFVIEEGLPISELEAIVKSMSEYAKLAGVSIVTGDTKVVNRGQCDKIFINTSGVGYVPENVNISGQNARVGDTVIISGSMADHGVAVLMKREGLEFESDVKSDSYPLNGIVKAVMEKYPEEVRVLRDPTRGGLATTLNEIARQSDVGIRIYEEQIPIKESVIAVCEILGLEPLYIANEGKMIFICSPEVADDVVNTLKNIPESSNASIIGVVTSENAGRLTLKTAIGGERYVDMLYGEALPRIC